MIGSAAGVRRDDATPLYHQIFLGLRDDILSGRRAHGTTVPTEQALAADHGVSRITARRALDELAAAGLVERRRRTGTRVTHRARRGPFEVDVDRAIDTLLGYHRDTPVAVIEVAEEPADPLVAERLRIAPGTAVVRAVRVRHADGQPIGEVVSYAPAIHAALMTAERLAQWPILELLEKAGATLGGGRQAFSAQLADPALAARLGIEPRGAVLQVERLMSDPDGQPLLLTIARYRGDSYRLTLDMTHGAG